MEKKYNVLIVEDEMLVRVGIQSLIDWDELGLILLGDAENGEEGLRYFEVRERVPDIVFTDINMPVMDGIEMMKSVRELGYENCIFIVLTVLEDFDYARKALRLGAFDYIPKFGMTKDNLRETLQKAIKKMQSIYDARHTEVSGIIPSLANIMQGYLQLHLYTLEEVSELLEKQGESFGQGYYLCAAACIRDAGQEGEEEADSLINVALVNTISDLLTATGEGCVYAGETGIYHFIFSFEQREKNLVEALFEKIQDIIQLYFNCRLQAGFSEWGDDLGDLPLLLEESRKVLGVNFFWDLGERLFWEEDYGDRVIRHCLEEVRKVELAGSDERDGRRVEKIHSMDMRDVDKQKRQLIQWEYAAFQAALQDREIPFSVDEQSLLLAESGSKKCARKITKIFVSRLEKKLESWKQEIGETRELRLAMEFIKKHYQENITVSQIAEAAGYSSGYLTSVFKKKNGKTVMEYLNWYRVEEAKALLRESGLKSYEIAEKVGFSDPNYFSRIFKKYVGKSVNEYKKRR